MKINIKGTAMISRDLNAVFKYFSDFRNDIFWRKEISASAIKKLPIAIGTEIIQHAFLSKKLPDFVTELTCTAYIENEKMVCETKKESKFWLKSTRSATPISPNRTHITYQLEFDTGIIKHGLGFGLPKIIVTVYTTLVMKKYVRVLKAVLENNEQPIP